jgi:uncharacterized protein
MLKQQIDKDIKEALLSQDQFTVNTLRGLKSAILYVEVSMDKRSDGLDDESIISVINKEVKKRTESAELYSKGGNNDMAEKELKEKDIISKYLPEQMSEDKIQEIVEAVIKDMQDITMKDMGKIIGLVKSKTGSSADGATISNIVKNRINNK